VSVWGCGGVRTNTSNDDKEGGKEGRKEGRQWCVRERLCVCERERESVSSGVRRGTRASRRPPSQVPSTPFPPKPPRINPTQDEVIDVIEGNRKYIRCLYAYNKIDTITIEEVDKLAREPDAIVISVRMKLNLDRLLAKMWDYMGLIRVYTKRRGAPPLFHEPLVLSSERKGISVEVGACLLLGGVVCVCVGACADALCVVDGWVGLLGGVMDG
jgi:hypothetical protein